MKRLAPFPLIAISILACSSSSWCNSRCPHLTELDVIQHEDTLDVFVAEALNRGDLSLADQIIAAQSKLDSNAIQWYFFRGIRSYMEKSYEQDRQNEENIRRVQVAMEKAIEIGERRLEINPSDSIALFYAGGACGYLGIAQVQGGGGFFKAGSTAKKGSSITSGWLSSVPGIMMRISGRG